MIITFFLGRTLCVPRLLSAPEVLKTGEYQGVIRNVAAEVRVVGVICGVWTVIALAFRDIRIIFRQNICIQPMEMRR
jgi:hypothetical protein